MLRITTVLVLTLLLAATSNAQSRRGSNEAEPHKVYNENTERMLRQLVVDGVFDDADMFTEQELEDFKKIERKVDSYKYDKPSTLVVNNKTIPHDLSRHEPIVIKMGHTFTSTLVFTDAQGNPWSVDTLANLSDENVAEVVNEDANPAHMISVRPKVTSGQTNLPVKLKGHQYPLSIIFDVDVDEVYLISDIRLNGLGDSDSSRRASSVSFYEHQKTPPPNFNVTPGIDSMLQRIDPEGYKRRQLVNEYGVPVDSRDFVAWSKDGKLYVLTPFHKYSPDPIGVSVSSSGRERLFEFNETPVLTMRRNEQIVMMMVR